MQRESGKIVLACAMGAFVGALVALQISHHFAWVGLVVGFAVGYLSYRWREVVAAVPEAKRMASAAVPKMPGAVFSILKMAGKTIGQPLREFFGPTRPLFYVYSLIGMVFCGWMLEISEIQGFSERMLIALVIMTEIIGMLIGNFLGGIMLFGGTLITLLGKDDEYIPRGLDKFVESRPPLLTVQMSWSEAVEMHLFLLLGLPRTFFRIVGLMFGAVAWCMRLCVRGIELIAFGVWYLFRLIHSERRLLCGTDAAVGAAIGFATGSALIGAATGAAIGLINYELVTLRILKPRGLLIAT